MNREIILTACQDIIYRYGLQQLLMDEIAKTCGVSKKTVYALFGSKEALMETLANLFFESQRNTFQQGLDGLSGAADKLKFIIHQLYRLGELIPFEELEFLKKKHRKNYHLLLSYVEELTSLLAELMDAEKICGHLYADIDVPTQVELLMAQLQHLHTNHRKLLLRHPSAHWIQQISNAFFRANYCANPGTPNTRTTARQ